MSRRITPILLALLFSMASWAALVPPLEVEERSLTSARSLPCSGDICLNEAMPNPNGYDDAAWPNGEWFELTNTGTTSIAVNGWYAMNKNGKQLTFDSSSIVGYNSSDSNSWTIAPGDYLVIARNASPNFYLTNSAETLELFDSSSSKKDEASWSSAQSGAAYVEDPADAYADWITAAGATPGSSNSGATAPTYYQSDLIITEVMPNPWPSADNATWPGGEWVELYNNGSTSFDVSGWNLTDSAGNVITLDENHMIGFDAGDSTTWNLEPGEYAVVAVNTTGSYGVLNNGQEELFLKWPNGTISEKISWSSANSGMSLVKDSSGQMNTAVFPTQGYANTAPIESIINASSDVSLNEVLPNATADGNLYSSGGEWLELYNNGSTQIDMSGWVIRDGMGNETSIENSLVGGGSTIDAGTYALVQFVGDTQLWDYYNHLCLVDASGHILDVLHWDANHGENISLVRGETVSEAWTPAAHNTPGAENPSTGTVDEARILINEVMSNPIGNDTSDWPDGEWVELLNIGEEEVDLSGWKLQAGGIRNLQLTSERLMGQENLLISPGEHLVVAVNSTSSFYLRNTNGDSLALFDDTGATQQTVVWSFNVTEGESLVASPTSFSTDWIQSLWPTPGEPNPEFGNYSGPTHVQMNEILPHCNDESIDPVDDWIEIHNTGSEAVNLSRWSLASEDGDTVIIRHNNIWNRSSDDPAVTMVAAGGFIVVQAPAWFVLGYGDTVYLTDPNGGGVHSVSWDFTVDCRTIGPDPSATDGAWTSMMWSTPGEENPDPADFDFASDVMFTRLMPDETSYTERNNEFIELTNLGDAPVDMRNHVIRRHRSGSTPYDGMFENLILAAGESVMLTPNAEYLKQDSGLDAVDASTVMNTSVFLTNSGAALQLLAPDGSVLDAVVYGNANPVIEGWTGAAISEPNGSTDGMVYIRGDGCSVLPDSNTSQDWQMRWSRIGASQICSTPSFSSTGSATPTISPQGSLHQIVEWLDSAQESIHVHMYELHSPEISFALRQAAERGVEVTVVLDEGASWWDSDALRWQRGHASDLAAAGATVYWFGEPTDPAAPDAPYEYLHSKVAVVDNSSVWMGSGNWKRSTLPIDGSAGNIDWGVIINSMDIAQQVLERLAWDENPDHPHIKLHDPTSSTQGTPSGWSTPAPTSGTFSPPESTYTLQGDLEGMILTCPDDCMSGLVWLIDQSEEELLLSLQNLDMDWYWGWGTNPLLTAIEEAADRGVKIRLVINGYYYDDEIQEAVDWFNDPKDSSWDTEAVIMSSSDNVTKLHNKGVIVDGELSLFSSINWGANAVIRNREMGIILQSEELGEVMRNHWLEDWNRLDSTTDTDRDGMSDLWEVENNLNRTSGHSSSGVHGEELDDPDQDGLNNLLESRYLSNPHSSDTDGDCIPDLIEVSIATDASQGASMEIRNQTIRLALSSNDFDADGINDGDQWSCGEGIEPDSDADGIPDSTDECPGSPTEAEVDEDGCSNQQRPWNDKDQDGVDDSLDNCEDTSASEVALGTGGNPVAEEHYRGCSPSQLDADLDGIFDERDECPDTPSGEDVNIEGCSAEQMTEKAKSGSNEGEEGVAGTVFTVIMVVSGLGLGGWMLSNMMGRKEGEILMDDPIPQNLVTTAAVPVLDGSAMPVLDGSAQQPAIDMSQFPGWEEATVQTYLEQGWSIAQLKEWYDNSGK